MKTILVDAVFAFVSEKGEIFKKLHKLLESYPNNKIILTNADYKKDNLYNLNNMPYEVFTLKKKPTKLNPKYYKQMLSHFNLKPTDVVYFEHSLEAVQSARSVGIKTQHYDEDKKDLFKLKSFLDKNL